MGFCLPLVKESQKILISKPYHLTGGVYNTKHFSDCLVLFMYFRVIGVIKSNSAKNDLLQKSENVT